MRKYELAMKEFILILIFAIVPLVIIKIDGDYYTYGKIYVGMMGILIYIIYEGVIKKKFSFKTIDIFILALMNIIILSTINSVDPIKALIGEEFRREGCITLMYYFLIFSVFSRNFIVPRKKARVCIEVITAAISFYTIYQFYFWDPFIDWRFGSKHQFSCVSTLGNRNFVSSYLVMCTVLYMTLYLIYNKRRYYINSLLFFCGVIATLTRGGWVAIVAIIFLLPLIIYKFKLDLKKYIILILSFVIIFVIMVVTNEKVGLRFNAISADIERSSESDYYKNGSGRIYIWENSIELLGERPLLGSGPDTFKNVFRGNYNGDNYKQLKSFIVFDKAHNEYLQLAVTLGIPYIAIYCMFLIVILKIIYRSIEKNIGIMAIFLTVISYLIQAFFNISTVGVAPVFWALLGIGVNLTLDNYKDIKWFNKINSKKGISFKAN